MDKIGGIIILILLAIWALPLAFMALLPAALSMALVFLTTQLLYKSWLNQAVARGWVKMNLNPDTETGNIKVRVTDVQFVSFFSFLIIATAGVVAVACTGVLVNLFSKTPDFSGLQAFAVFVFAQVGWIWFSARFYPFGNHSEMLQRAAAAALDAPGLAGKFAALKSLDTEAAALLRQTGTASAAWPFGIERWLRSVPFMGLGNVVGVHQEIDRQIVLQQEAVAELAKCVARVNLANEKIVTATRQALKAPNGLFWETAISDEKEKLQYEELYSLLLTKRWREFHEIMDEIIGGLDRALAEMARGNPSGSPNGSGGSIRDRAAALDFFGVSESTPFEEIKALRRELVKKYHQDHSASMSENARRHLDRRFAEIQEAWKILSEHQDRSVP